METIKVKIRRSMKCLRQYKVFLECNSVTLAKGREIHNIITLIYSCTIGWVSYVYSEALCAFFVYLEALCAF
jgi:hypothetical protein